MGRWASRRTQFENNAVGADRSDVAIDRALPAAVSEADRLSSPGLPGRLHAPFGKHTPGVQFGIDGQPNSVEVPVIHLPT